MAPDKGKLKVNCDAAIPATEPGSKAAVVLRNWKGKIVDGFARSVHVGSSLGGELYAIRAACELVIGLGLKEVEVGSDNKQAIFLSVSELMPPWEIRALVVDILDTSQGKENSSSNGSEEQQTKWPMKMLL